MDSITLTRIGGPYGDECSTYKFVLNREMTLQEFAEHIAVDREDWGEIININGGTLAEYNKEKIGYCANRNMVIAKEGKACGGWSNMDYYVKVVCDNG